MWTRDEQPSTKKTNEHKTRIKSKWSIHFDSGSKVKTTLSFFYRLLYPSYGKVDNGLWDRGAYTSTTLVLFLNPQSALVEGKAFKQSVDDKNLP